MADNGGTNTYENTFMVLFVWESATPPCLQAVQHCEQYATALMKGPAATIDGRFSTKPRQQTAP